MRISIKQLQDRIDTINGLTNNKYKISLYKTTGCGDIEDLIINLEKYCNKTIYKYVKKEMI